MTDRFETLKAAITKAAEAGEISAVQSVIATTAIIQAEETMKAVERLDSIDQRLAGLCRSQGKATEHLRAMSERVTRIEGAVLQTEAGEDDAGPIPVTLPNREPHWPADGSEAEAD